MVITALIVCPNAIGTIASANEITDEHLIKAKEIMVSDNFKDNFRNMC